MYRAMIEESEKSLNGTTSSPNKMALTAVREASPQKLQELQHQLAIKDDEKNKLVYRLNRFEDQERNLSGLLEKNQAELNSLRKEVNYF